MQNNGINRHVKTSRYELIGKWVIIRKPMINRVSRKTLLKKLVIRIESAYTLFPVSARIFLTTAHKAQLFLKHESA